MDAAVPETLTYDLGRPFKVHDVRKLRQCSTCGRSGTSHKCRCSRCAALSRRTITTV